MTLEYPSGQNNWLSLDGLPDLWTVERSDKYCFTVYTSATPLCVIGRDSIQFFNADSLTHEEFATIDAIRQWCLIQLQEHYWKGTPQRVTFAGGEKGKQVD